eukprot:gene7830-8466_t
MIDHYDHDQMKEDDHALFPLKGNDQDSDLTNWGQISKAIKY